MHNVPRIGVHSEALSQRCKDMDWVRTVSPASGCPPDAPRERNQWPYSTRDACIRIGVVTQVTPTWSTTIAALDLILSVVDRFKEES